MKAQSSTALSYLVRLGAPIVATATASGGPVSILRVSGADLSVFQKILGPLPAPGTFALRKIKDRNGLVIDQALLLYFKAPHSFTGEDVVEIQGHGIVSVIENITHELLFLGAQKALPGEFSFRAVSHGQMTLAEAESLNAALSAEGLGAAWASKLLGLRKSGDENLQYRFEKLLSALSVARGRTEAAIDFPEAEQEQVVEISSAQDLLRTVSSELTKLENTYLNFSKVSGEIQVALVGAPNAGKSTLLNILAGGQRALVSPIPGTTRDVVEIRIKIPPASPVRIFDTAGLRSNSHDELEKQGMALGVEVAESAHLIVWVQDVRDQVAKGVASELRQKIYALKKPVIEIGSHLDQAPALRADHTFDFIGDADRVLTYLFSILENKLRDLKGEPGGEEVLSKRQFNLAQCANEEISAAMRSLSGLEPIEICAERIKSAEKYLRAAKGEGLSDDYIGEIFKQFCLGK